MLIRKHLDLVFTPVPELDPSVATPTLAPSVTPAPSAPPALDGLLDNLSEENLKAAFEAVRPGRQVSDDTANPERKDSSRESALLGRADR